MTDGSRRLVVSAVNFSEGGPLTVLRDSLDAAATTLGPEWQIIALVHEHGLIDNPRVKTIAFPRSKRSWLSRLKLEWVSFAKLSRQIKPDLWLSLHDMTPRVMARRQAVYCHNPSPFYRANLNEAKFDPRFFLFNKLYMQLYKLLITRNHSVIVQQSWLRDAFARATAHPNIVVARPGSVERDGNAAAQVAAPPLRRATAERPLRLLYPALPRVFKNAEVLGEAVRLLPSTVTSIIDVRLTIDGTENRWAGELAGRYKGIAGISFIGRQGRAAMAAEYEQCDAVLFPSRLETWGLPITEAKAFGKPLLVADLPYAHETVGNYAGARFVAADDPQAWANEVFRLVHQRWEPEPHHVTEPAQPYFPDWPSLWRYLVAGL